MRPVGILILLFFTGRLSAQQVNGTVIDQSTRLPVANATVIAKAGAAFTSATGSFSVNYLATGDTITIKHIGYKTYKMTVINGLIPINIYLLPDNFLNEVTIKSKRNAALDSVNIRKEFAKTFTYHATTISDVFVKVNPYVNSDRPRNTSQLVTIDFLQVLNMISKNKAPQSKLQKTLLQDEQDAYIYRMFSKEKIEAVTPLQGDSLQEFMIRYSPTADAARKMSGYEMMMYIKKSYADYSKKK